MNNSAYDHVYPVIDLMVAAAERDIVEDDEIISCRKGCAHCCHLLVEVFWEEARELVKWIQAQPEPARSDWYNKVNANATEFEQLCNKRKHWRRYAEPFSDEDMEFTDGLCDAYFGKTLRPCTFLGTDGACQSYTARPSSCRLHLVTSDPELCKADVEDDEDYNVPDRIEELGDEVGAINSAAATDGRRGQMAVMVSAVLAEEFNVNIKESNYETA
jgi:Fe-S-cluster containining protein